jgi:signal transduction histidine kinase/ActR/RegA family two-component response regulator
MLAELARGPAEGGWSTEYRWQCADGSYKHFLDQAVLLRDADGGAVEFAGTLLDVTDRRELELQLARARKMDAIGKLTGGIAHDFNNVLAAILGGVGLIERRVSLTDEQRRIVTMTRHAAEQGAELVRRLLAFARGQKLDPASLDVETICQSVSDLMAHTLGGLVQLEWSVARGIGPVYADQSQLELALMNLIINARDSMPEGGVINLSAEGRRVAVENDLGLAAGDYVVMSVTDTGSGIPSEILDKVLEPFFSTKEMGKGTGLGLSMVYGFIQQSGGNVGIYSSVGQGTRVEIWLPAAVEAPNVGAGEILPSTVAVPQAVRRRILLVDDHEGVRATTRALLQEFGHEVEEAEGAGRALAMLENDASAFDLLVTDYAMPMMTGSEFIERARRLAPSLPAIIVTGYMDISQLSHSPHGVEIISKPFSAAELARVMSLVFQLDAEARSTTGLTPETKASLE